MLPQVVLTFGWPGAKNSEISAKAFLDMLKEANVATLANWVGTMVGEDRTLRVYDLDGLFRRGPGGMTAMREMVGLLGEKLQAWKDVSVLQFDCDAFAYAFLKQTHNYDVILPEAANPVGTFRQQLGTLKATLDALAEFERSGTALPATVSETEQGYLRVRASLSRPSARLERVILATLLINGPSTLQSLSPKPQQTRRPFCASSSALLTRNTSSTTLTVKDSVWA